MTKDIIFDQVSIILLYRLSKNVYEKKAQEAWKRLRQQRHNFHDFFTDFTFFHIESVDLVELDVIRDWYNLIFEKIVLERFPMFLTSCIDQKKAFMYKGILHLYGNYPGLYPIYLHYHELEKRLLRLERVLQVLA